MWSCCRQHLPMRASYRNLISRLFGLIRFIMPACSLAIIRQNFILFTMIWLEKNWQSFLHRRQKKVWKSGWCVTLLPTFLRQRKCSSPLVDAGGKVVHVKPYFTHYRSHRKIVSIDQKIHIFWRAGYVLSEDATGSMLSDISTRWKRRTMKWLLLCASLLWEE